MHIWRLQWPTGAMCRQITRNSQLARKKIKEVIYRARLCCENRIENVKKAYHRAALIPAFPETWFFGSSKTPIHICPSNKSHYFWNDLNESLFLIMTKPW